MGRGTGQEEVGCLLLCDTFHPMGSQIALCPKVLGPYGGIVTWRLGIQVNSACVQLL